MIPTITMGLLFEKLCFAKNQLFIGSVAIVFKNYLDVAKCLKKSIKWAVWGGSQEKAIN